MNPGPDQVVESAVQRGWGLHDMGRYEAAEAEARHGLAADPHDVRLLMLLNRALGHQRRFQEAREACRAALRVDPGDAGAWAELGMVSMALLEEQPALAAVARALELEPQDPFVLTRAGIVQDFFGRHEEAAAARRRLVELDPSPEHLVQLARSLLHRGDTAGALGLAGRALAADPALPAARAVAAEVRFLDGDHDQAREHALAVLRQDPGNADARAVVDACARMVEAELADPGGDAADSSHPEHLGHQAEDALLNGDGAAAIALATQNLRRNPGSPLAVECWARIVQELDLPLEQVGPIMASFAGAFPQHPGVAFRIGELLAHHGRTEEALGWFERVLELDPDDGLARHNADVLRMRAGR